MPHTNIDPRTRSTAKRLRRDQTGAERKMWRLLRPFRDDGISFRRQAPVGPYVIDFVWLRGKLAIGPRALLILPDGTRVGFSSFSTLMAITFSAS